jgi:hypothetical protein
MSFLEIVFDPASFAGGSVVTALAFSAKSIRNKIQANGASAKVAQLSLRFKPLYAELEKKLEAAEERMSVFSFEYIAAYPSGQKNPLISSGIQSAWDRARKSLNAMLNMLNELDNTHVSPKTINDYAVLLGNTSVTTESALKDVGILLERYEGKLHTSIGKIANLKRDAKILGDNLAKAQADYADASTRFDRLFLESVPPALFKAEKAYETFCGYLNELIDTVENGRGYAAYDSCANQRSACMKAMTTLENHLHKVLVFSDVAKSEASRLRVELRRVHDYSGSGEQRDIDYDAALESIMEAESRPYDKGNPRVEFEDTIKPFRTFAHNVAKSVYRRK